MSRPSVRLLAAFAAAALLAAPATSHAQLGGLMKRAAEKAAQRTAERAVDKKVEDNLPPPVGCEPTFDARTAELTPERLEKMFAWEDQLKARTRDRNSPLAKLYAKRDDVQAELEELREDESLQQYEEDQQEWEACRTEGRMRLLGKKMAEKGPMAMLNPAGDPEFQRLQRESAQMNERADALEAKGDTAKANAVRDSASARTWTYYGASPADTLAIAKKCGRPPRPSAKAERRDSLEVALRDVNDEIRTEEEKVDLSPRKTTGLTRGQYEAARERIVRFNQNASNDGYICGFTKPELQALRERKDKLREYYRG